MSDEYTPQAWRMAGYYPGQYAKSMSALGIGIDYSDDDYDRYEAEFMADLAAHDERVKAEAKAEALEEAAAEIENTFVVERRTLGMSTQQWLAERAAAIRAAAENGESDE